VNTVEYVQGADLPDLAINWYDSEKVLIDFTTGYNFELKVGKPGQAALITKSTGFIASLVSPNLTVQWAAEGELNTLIPGVYKGQLKATRAADQRSRFLVFNLEVTTPVL
jgi:hypothetical protein